MRCSSFSERNTRYSFQRLTLCADQLPSWFTQPGTFRTRFSFDPLSGATGLPRISHLEMQVHFDDVLPIFSILDAIPGNGRIVKGFTLYVDDNMCSIADFPGTPTEFQSSRQTRPKSNTKLSKNGWRTEYTHQCWWSLARSVSGTRNIHQAVKRIFMAI